MSGTTINILILNAYPNLQIIEVDNWDSYCCIGKRSDINSLNSISACSYLSHPGIYLLLGKKHPTNTKVYIGESEEIITRLKQHSRDKKKMWFEEFIAFSSKKGDLNKAHIKFLENYFIEKISNNIFPLSLDNTCKYKTKAFNKLQYFDEAKAKGFKDRIIFILKHLNLIDFTQPVKKPPLTTNKEKKPVVFYIRLPKQSQEYQARMVISNNSYILLKESYIIKQPSYTFQNSNHYYKRWLHIIKNQAKPDLKNPNCYITTEDISFSSPSYAGTIVNARSTNGRTAWKLPDGTTLHEYEQNYNLKNNN